MSQVNPYTAPANPAEGEMNAMETYSPQLFAMSGRIGRLRYLAYMMAYYLIFGVVFGAGAAIFMPLLGDNSVLMTVAVIMAVVGYIAMLVVILSLGRRRFNDLDKSGWMLLLLFVPLVNMVVGIYMMFWPGSAGVNRFGAKPEPNSALVTIAGLLLPVIAIIGIVAAVALPAYQDYTERVQAAQQSN